VIIRKRDGGYNYSTSDLATIRYRIRDLHVDRAIYVVGSSQALHFQMVFAVARQAGWIPAGARFEHAQIGNVLGTDGKLLRTLHALRWFTDEAFRRRIGRQLNRGEALNDLRRCIFFANRGAVRHPHHDDQSTQAHCHTLVVNACVLSTTGYLQDAIDAQRADGHPVSADAIAHLSPAQFETINPYGTLTFDIAGVLERPRRALLRPNAR